jgi:hypothetical protein
VVERGSLREVVARRPGMAGGTRMDARAATSVLASREGGVPELL